MNLQKVLVPLGGLVLLVLGYRSWGWMGVFAVTGGLLMFLLLHFTRTMQVMRRAADRPIGYVGSAVMLNAKLKPKMALLHVVAMTRSLGELQSPPDTQPEVYRWRDNGESYVDATFAEGKLVQWQLTRPAPAAEAAPAQEEGAVVPAEAPARDA
ncbi:glycerate kinase [Xenophilus arseniciresistens]|uniref:Glycerate kinase n=1 Tax=Xenophilus arseniciresistens TaxID=1283306 RepID=A0AAE3T1V0_9BURK|nr:glycerate kinase [Xenophilus arseniciresistens]MDA7418341.1 glycerate kinase [Xenophilus arseniciresistens]